MQGLYTLTGVDLMEGREFACPVARCAHPMDIHNAASSRQTLTRLEKPAYVPHTALIPQYVTNLIAAGRCISADREALASLRVQGTLMSVGEGAGILGALACQNNCKAYEISEEQLKCELNKRNLVL